MAFKKTDGTEVNNIEDLFFTDATVVTGYDNANLNNYSNMWGWGYNTYGQLLGTTTYTSGPTKLGRVIDWQSISSKSQSVAALKPDNSLWTWGQNTSGQLGDGTTVNKSSPVQVGLPVIWTTSSNSSIGIKSDSTMWNISGPSPIRLSGISWQNIACGYLASALAIKTDGTLWAWGNNAWGHLGNGNMTTIPSPTQIGSLTNWKQIAISNNGNTFTAAIKTDGTLWAWGYNGYGCLGDGFTTTHASSPVQVGSLTTWKQVSCGHMLVAAIKTDGTLWTWGANVEGALGNGSTIPRSSPVQVGSLTTWSQIEAFGRFTTAIKTDGTLWAWGNNFSGQLGDGTLIDKSSPIQIGSLTNWKQVSCGYRHTTAIKTDGTLWACGYNTSGQLGDGTIVNKSSPVQVGSLTTFSQIEAFGRFTTAIKTD